ncbi:MAG: holo-[acyl-carrier-protein] synthase [Phycisphaerae bacterium]|nr:holo-[acyl-carrier-protein] synthase [Phycisphaerae bacterium]
MSDRDGAPRIVGHGIDLVEDYRIARMVEEHGDRFLERIFTPGERSDAGGAGRVERLAARFAAKEAVLKALGTGWRGGIAWTDVEVVREASGRPTVRLGGEARMIAARLGIDSWHLSLSHSGGFSIASAIAWGNSGGLADRAQVAGH